MASVAFLIGTVLFGPNPAVLVAAPAAAAPPAITVQPTGGQAVVGSNVTLAVTATGTDNQYQWEHDDVAIPGATSPILTLANVQESDGGTYSVEVTNAEGQAGSIAVRVTVVPRPVLAAPSTLTVTTLAGVPPGASDGSGSTARFWAPHGVAVDGAGNLYVADTDNFTIRKITPSGSVTALAGLAGSAGDVDAQSSAARFGFVSSIAIDASGDLYVTDWNGVRKITPGGLVTTLIGPQAGVFSSTDGVAVDGSGNLYVCDRQDMKISKVAPDGTVSTLAGGTQGSADGTGSAAQFYLPSGVAADPAGNVYVADQENCTIRKITPTSTVTTLAGSAGDAGSADGAGSAARFWYPAGVAVDAAGNVYVADTGQSLIRKITPAGIVSTLAGRAGIQGNTDGSGSGALFDQPWGLTVDASGNLFVDDTGNNTIRKITPGGVVTTVAGLASAGNSDGLQSAARFQSPFGIAVDGLGNLYVTDQLNNTVRKITPDGMVRTLAGIADGKVGYVDGSGAVARFWWPFSIAVDGAGNVYVADKMNNVIRKITADGVVSTLAGSPYLASGGSVAVGTQNPGGSADGQGSAAQFYGPAGVAVDQAGTVYVADQQNATIREITPAGMVTTLAGSPRNVGSADGAGSAARFNLPTGVAVDNAGNVYVADEGNSTIRKVTPAGVVTTLAGSAGNAGSIDGVGTAARFNRPTSIAIDSANNLYVADDFNDTIRLITPSGNVTTLAGYAGLNGQGHGEISSVGYADGTGSNARFNYPTGVAVDDFGNVYVTDHGNNTIRKAYATTPAAPPPPTSASAAAITYDGFTAQWAGVAGATGYRLDVSTTSDFSHYVDGYQNLDTGTAFTFGVSGLEPDTTYYFRVRAYNDGSTSDNSITISVTTASAPPSPAYTPLMITTIAGQTGVGGGEDGTGLAARFNSPCAAAADTSGNVYIADTDNDTIRKYVVSTGVVTTIAGMAGGRGDADGAGSNARFDHPSGVAVDTAGNVYVADTLNHTIRKLSPSGVVTTIAGLAGSAGSADGIGSAARFFGPQGLATDGIGTLYVADTNNHTIRKIELTTDSVSTLAGSPGMSGAVNGSGAQARFNAPEGVAVLGGNIYVADTDNHEIREISPSGSVTTVAGAPGISGSSDGIGGDARFDFPADLTVESDGTLYVADTDNHTVRSIALSTGIVTTVAGSAGNSGSTDGVGSAARFFAPAGIASDQSGNIYVVDTDNDTLRSTIPTAAPVIQVQPGSQTVNAGANVQFTVIAGGRPLPTYQWYDNGAAIDGATGDSLSMADVQGSDAGGYTVTVSNCSGSVTSNIATLTVNPAGTPSSPSGGGPSGTGGGGVMEAWFDAALALLGIVSILRRPRSESGF